MDSLTRIIDYDRLLAESDAMADAFANADPFPHIVIDDFLSADYISALNASFPDFARKKKSGSTHIPVILEDGSEAQLGKEWLSREQLVPLIYRRLYWEAGVLGQEVYLQAEAAGQPPAVISPISLRPVRISGLPASGSSTSRWSR